MEQFEIEVKLDNKKDSKIPKNVLYGILGLIIIIILIIVILLIIFINPKEDKGK